MIRTAEHLENWLLTFWKCVLGRRMERPHSVLTGRRAPLKFIHKTRLLMSYSEQLLKVLIEMVFVLPYFRTNLNLCHNLYVAATYARGFTALDHHIKKYGSTNLFRLLPSATLGQPKRKGNWLSAPAHARAAEFFHP